MNRHDLPDLLYDSLEMLGGNATIVGVCKYIWNTYEDELRKSNDLFYTWRYDIRWAATELRKTERMKSDKISPKGIV